MPHSEPYVSLNLAEGGSGLVTLSVISHGHRLLISRLLRDLALFHPSRLALIVITLNLAEERPEVPAGFKIPIQWCSNADPHGFGSNHNRAFGFCKTEWFAVVNPDIQLLSDPFERLSLVADHEVGIVAPSVIDPSGKSSDAVRGLITPLEIFRRTMFTQRQVKKPAWIAGMFLIVRSVAFRGVGGFDERYYLYCEDFDLCARIRLLGWDIALDQVTRVMHDAQRESHKSIRHFILHLQSLIRMWTSRTWWRYREYVMREETVALRPIHQFAPRRSSKQRDDFIRAVRPLRHDQGKLGRIGSNREVSRRGDE